MTALRWEDLLGPEDFDAVCCTAVGAGAGTSDSETGTARVSSAAAERALNELVADALRYRRSAEYAKLILFLRHFRRYRPFNGLLIDIQKPGSHHVAPASRWRREYGRVIRPGASPLVILQPFGPVMFVFDVSDTQPETDASPPLPEEITDPFGVLTTTSDHVVEAITAQVVENAKRDGVQIVDSAFGNQLAGRISTGGRGSQQVCIRRRPESAYVTVPVRYTCQISDKQSGMTRYATLTHELAHLYCGHIGTPNEKWWPDFRRKDHRTAEFEAETVSAILVGQLDSTAQMPPYLSQHLRHEELVPADLNLERVMKAAGLIQEMGERLLPSRG